MKVGSMVRGMVAVLCVSGASAHAFAQGSEQGCSNCEAKVVLDAVAAQALLDAVMTINSMPLHGVVLDPGVPGGNAQVLIATYPDYAAQNGLDSFDVAQKVLGFAGDARFGIRSVTATWISPLDKGDARDAKAHHSLQSNVGTIGH